MKAALLSRYKEPFVPQINTSDVPFRCVKVRKVRAPLPVGTVGCMGGTHGAAGKATPPLQWDWGKPLR